MLKSLGIGLLYAVIVVVAFRGLDAIWSAFGGIPSTKSYLDVASGAFAAASSLHAWVRED